MSLLTVAQVRDQIETDLVNDAVQQYIDDADAEIIERLGALASETEVLRGGNSYLHLQRKASSITSATERVDATNYALVASDYSLLSDGYRVERLTTGTNGAANWRGMVTITYATASNSAERTRLEIDLVKLAIRYEARRGQSVGDMSVQLFDNYQAERERLFRALLWNRRRPLV